MLDLPCLKHWLLDKKKIVLIERISQQALGNVAMVRGNSWGGRCELKEIHLLIAIRFN